MPQYHDLQLHTCFSCFFIDAKITYRNLQLNFEALSTFARTMKPALFSTALVIPRMRPLTLQFRD